MDIKTVNTIVIGGGISGLSSAKLLHESGIDVLVLEARDRVGGRTWTIRNPNVQYVDLGGAYVGPTQDRVLRLAKELGIETYKINNKGDYVHYSHGSPLRFQGSWPRFWNPLAWCDVNNIFRKFDKLIENVPVEAPWKTPNAKTLDGMTVQQWMDAHCWTEAAKEFFRASVAANVTMEPCEISLLWYMWYVKSCGGSKRIWEVENGGQERKFVGGSGQISERIAERLGERVLLNHAVSRISQHDGLVTVETWNGKTFNAEHVVLAVSPTLHTKIRFVPALPPIRAQFIQRVPMGSCIKNMCYYDTPFWREKGMNGFGSAADGIEPVANTVDDCKPDGSKPCIVGFIIGEQARKLAMLTREERQKTTAEFYSRLYGSEEALKVVHYEEGFWMGEEWSGGCYTSTYPPNVMTQYGHVVREPLGRVHFAGTETAVLWTGYMDGAVEAGERAAREVLVAQRRLAPHQVWRDEAPSQDVPAQPFEETFAEKNAPAVESVLKVIGVGAAAAAVGALWGLKSRL